MLVIVDENHTQHQVQAGMPYLVRLQKTFGVTTHHTAATHLSLLDNYLLIAGGSTFGVTGAATPSSHPVAGRSVFGAALARGKTARAYNEMITPNLCNDAHDCSLGTADAFLRHGYRGPTAAAITWPGRYQYAQLFTMVLAVLVELHGEGNLTARRADQAMAHVMVNALRHGAYRAGIKGLSAKFGASEATVKRASAQVRLNGGDPADAMLWRIRGRKGEGVTLWLPSTALVDALWRKHSARKATARDRKAERKAKRVNGSRTHGVKMSHVASLDSEAGQRGSQNPPAVSAASQKNIPKRTNRTISR